MSAVLSPNEVYPVHDQPLIRSHVYALIAVHNVGAAERFNARFAPIPNEEPASEIRRLNRFWRNELAKLPGETLNERDHLIDVCTVGDWLRLFQHGVLHTLLLNNLPMV